MAALTLRAVEQDHRAIKRVTRPMLNFKHTIRRDQFAIDGATAMSFADQFDALAGQIRPG
jgi:putative transposase